MSVPLYPLLGPRIRRRVARPCVQRWKPRPLARRGAEGSSLSLTVSLLLCISAFVAHGCGTQRASCPGNVATSLVVTVRDQATGLNVCDASVVASAGSSVFAGQSTAPDGSCSYTIDVLKAGTYAVTATAPMLHMVGSPPMLDFQFDDCGYSGATQYVTIEMSH
jgi:hypothetical protein